MENQEKKNPIGRLMQETMEQVRAMADADIIVGTPIEAQGVTLIPVSRMSIGVGTGGTEFSTKKQQAGGDNAFGGGGAASAKLEPVAFLVIRDGNVKLLPVFPAPATTLDRVIDTVPEVVDKVTDFLAQQKEKSEFEGE